MRHLLARLLTGLGIIAAAVLAWSPRHPAAPRIAPPAHLAAPPRAAAATREAAPIPPKAPPAAAEHAPVPKTPERSPAPSATPHARPLPPIAAQALLKQALGTLKSAPAFHGTLTEHVGRALPAVDRLIGADATLMAPGSRSLSIWHDPPDLWRIATRSGPHAPVGRLTVADGRTVTDWTRRGDTYTVVPQHPGSDAPPGLGGLDTLLAQLRRGATLRVVGQGRVDGHAAYRLHAVQHVGGLEADAVDLWVDGRTYLPLRIDATGPAGVPLVSAGFTRIAFTKAPAARFRFVPPAGARRTGPVAARPAGPPARR